MRFRSCVLLMRLLLLTLTAASAAGAEPLSFGVPGQASDSQNQEKPETFEPGRWKNLFDGKSLDGWKRTNFSGGGEARVERKFRGRQAAIVVEAGTGLSGFNRTGEVPKTNYEVSLEAMKIEGADFMCGLTFPVGDSHASLILGGWGGGTVGISSIDGLDASENETKQFLGFARERWYKVRVRVTPEKIEVWLDGKRIINQEITGRKIGLRRGEIAMSVPLGVSTYATSAAFRALRLRRLPENQK